MAEVDFKAKALSDAKVNIRKLQEKITDAILKMAAEVEKLAAVVSPSEARTFLKAHCNLPTAELSTLANFSATLRGSEYILRNARASFPVIKALVSADGETRREVIERMELGAQLDARDISSIRRTLSQAGMTNSEIRANSDRRARAAAAGRHARKTAKEVEGDVAEFVRAVRALPYGNSQVPQPLRNEATKLLRRFADVFGDDHPEMDRLRRGSSAHRVPLAYHALKAFRDDAFEGRSHFSLRSSDLGPTAVTALQAFAGMAGSLGDLKRISGLTELPPKHHRLRVLELCAGGGGMALGLERAGFVSVGLIENNKHAAATLRKNRPDWNVMETDVRQVDFTKFRGKVDVIAGGVPCTPYSTIGERKGKIDEADLFPEAVRAVKEAKPKAFMFENVDGLLHSKHADHVAAILDEFSKAGYRTVIERINSRDYGVAQNRSRILIVGVAKDIEGAFRLPPKFPEMAVHMGDALAGLMAERGWQGAGDWAKKMGTMRVVDRNGEVVRTGILADTIRGYKGSGHKLEKLRWLRNGVAYAPIAKNAPTDEEATTPGFIPKLTNKMRARLQGFPDDWKFVGGIPSVADQIGNAVTPVVAQAAGLAMFSLLRRMEFDWKAMLFGSRERVVVAPPPLAPDNPNAVQSHDVEALTAA